MIILNSNDLDENFYSTVDYENLPEVDKIIEGVKKGGDSFLIDISKKFNDGDFALAEDFIVSEIELEEAYSEVSSDFIKHIKIAYENIKKFSEKQFECLRPFLYCTNDSTFGHDINAIDRVLAYVPGGNYPLSSTCIMTLVPAKVAGVKEVVLTSPRIKPETIVAAHIAGADKIYKLGGAQAIAAFAYGTETIEPVDKIVGPGNKYVTYAKKAVYGKVGIDFLAGPSEVLIIADEYANPKLIAADMLAQCEHDVDARAYLLTNSKELIDTVDFCAKDFLSGLKTADIARVSYEKSCAVLVSDIKEAIKIANKKAPEHLEVMLKEPVDDLVNFGSLFMGENSAEVFGDYVAGTNHVLPTNSAAKYTGGLSVFDFLKISTYQKIGAEYAKTLSKTASYLAESEGLFAHKLASDLRGDK